MGKSSKQRAAASRSRREKRREKRLSVAEEWIGGWTTLASHVYDEHQDAEPYRPLVLLWFSPSRGVVDLEVALPEEPERQLAELLSRAVRQPKVGPPRKPSHVRVADRTTADALLAAVPNGTELVVGDVSELKEVVESLHEFTMRGRTGEPSYLEGGRVAPDVVERFFRAAEQLCHLEPWEYMEEDELFRFDSPDLELSGHALSIIGSGGESFGVMTYESPGDFFLMRQYSQAANSRRTLPCPMFTIAFEPVGEISETMRIEVMKHGWPVRDAESFPVIFSADTDFIARPLNRRAYERATAYLEALAALLLLHEETILDNPSYDVGFRRASELIPGAPSLEIRVPYPGFAPERSPKTVSFRPFAITAYFADCFPGLDPMSPELQNAEQILTNLLGFRQHYSVSGRWNVQIFEALLRQYLADELLAPPLGLETVPKVFDAFLPWASSSGLIPERTVGAMKKALERLRKRFD